MDTAVTLFAYILLIVAVALFGAYTQKFQGATLYWGRRMAGAKSLEAEMSGASAQQKGEVLGRAMNQRGLQDAITPRIQTIRTVLFMVGFVAVPVVGFIFHPWYVAILGLVGTFVLVGISKGMFPSVSSGYYKSRLLSSLTSRASTYEKRGESMKAFAASEMKHLLANTEKDTA